MKHTLYAMLGACLTMLATGGLVALAATAQVEPDLQTAEQELVDQLDVAIDRQLTRLMVSLDVSP